MPRDRLQKGMDDAVKLIGAVAALITSFAWPLVAIWLIWKFAPAIRDFLAHISEGSVKGFGIEATAKRKAAEAIVNADISKVDLSKSTIQFSPGVGKSSALAALLTKAVSLPEVKGKVVLWIDDDPRGGLAEANALGVLGIVVDTATSLIEAVEKLKTKSYDVIIVDFLPRSVSENNFEFLKQLKSQQFETPVILYSKYVTPEAESEALKNGAFASTDKAFELLGLVISAIQRPNWNSAMWESYAKKL
jgi:CheY-like chemotaxis protein